MNKQICEDSLWLATARHIDTQYCWYSQLLEIFLSLFPVLLRTVEALDNICQRKACLPSQHFWLPTLNAPLQFRARKIHWLLGEGWPSLGAMCKRNNHPWGNKSLRFVKAWGLQKYRWFASTGQNQRKNLEELIQWKFKPNSVWKHKLFRTVCVDILIERRADNSAKVFCLTLCLLLLCLSEQFSVQIFLPLHHHPHVLRGHHRGLPGKLSWSDWSLGHRPHFPLLSFLRQLENGSFRNKMQFVGLIPKRRSPWHRTPSITSCWVTCEGFYHEHKEFQQ